MSPVTSVTTHTNHMTIGDPHKGCRHCGTVITRKASNGRATIHHPGTTCCTDAIQDQIRYREGDLARLKADGEQLFARIDDLEAKAGRAIGKEQTELLNAANRARAAYEHHTTRIRRELDGDRDSDTIGLKNELRELRAKLDQLTREERGW